MTLGPRCWWWPLGEPLGFGRAEISDNHESVKFVVCPMNALGISGEPIESKPGAYWSKSALYPF